MANWLNQDFRFNTEIIPSIAIGQNLTTQGTDLVNEINSVGGNNYILLGHSQGGLVARYAAQYYLQNQNANRVIGVVTVDTPNEGANIAFNGPFVLGAFLVYWGASLWDATGCYTPNDNMGCWIAAVLFTVGTVEQPLLDTMLPEFSDLTPGSNFLNSLNSTPEPNLVQAAVVGYTDQRWAVTRWIAEQLYGKLCPGPGAECCNPEDACGERNVALATSYFYFDVEAEYFFDLMMYYMDSSCYENPVPQYCVEYWDDAMFLLNIMFWMDFGDALWDILVDFPGDGSSDALVQGPSQLYPIHYANAIQYPIYHSDSHSGALRSTYDHTVLDNILANQFHVPTQASCSFSLPTTQETFNGNGGTGSFTLNTQTGCQWSAVSQISWASITSGVNGTSNGSVSFSVAANPSTVPRSGSIQVGSGTTQTLFQISQGGACLYTLSEGPEVASPPAGTSSTVWVYTGIDCPWSAVSGANWISIQSGYTGMGTGSFTWTTSPNTAAGDRSGRITVMNQTLTILDGSPVGTPGVGSVSFSINTGGGGSTIGGSLCLSNPITCDYINQENFGTVSVNVNGVTYSAPINGSSTSNQLASSIISQIGQSPLSLIKATASGSLVNITSSINGSATNYPLSTSYNFSPCVKINGTNYCMNGARVYATPSGASLTGGTN